MSFDAVLFDLDGTLLDIDIDGFLSDYFGALGPVIADVMGDGADPAFGLKAVLDATSAMMSPHPGRTNREVFNEHFRSLTSIDLDLDEFALPFERFYAEVFPSLRGSIGPMPQARASVTAALDRGLKVAIATNPIFPLSAIEERLRWADVFDLPVHAVTSYEIMHATKPSAAYFAETAELLGVRAERCLMVGDDATLDLGASGAGMATFYVGKDASADADFRGDLSAVMRLLAESAGRS